MTAAELGTRRADGSFSEVFGDALRGVVCAVRGHGDVERPLPVEDWLQPVTPADEALLAHCRGATLDVGCGPGRMSAHLAETGHVVLALDIVREAVRHARERGVGALHRNVFHPIPGEGRWETVLLADGNIGIGGAPLRLLRRAVELLAPRGRVVCDLALPGTGLRLHEMRLETAMKRSGSFPWAEVGTDAIGRLAVDAGLRVALLDHLDGRWFAVLSR
jgi:SAM-dependent methyltransferase